MLSVAEQLFAGEFDKLPVLRTMFVNRAREAPSVVSTRILKTHRMNSVEHFRLQERVKAIEYESQHNYSQISDEIDGVRQNLVKIKGVKKNVGVSVERRKLLRDKGLRILPSKQNGDVHYFTVRASNGKDVNILCSDFYDGDALRKQLNIEKFDLAVTPSLAIENSDSEDVIDYTSADSRGRCQSAPTLNLKEFRYRNITPPLRPGSRRNFKNVDDENSEDEEELLSLESFTNRERKYGILRPKTAYAERKRPVTQRPSTCPANIQEYEGKVPYRKPSRKNSQVAGNNKKKSRGTDSAVTEANASEKSAKQEQESDNQQKDNCNNNAFLGKTIPLKSSSRPKLRPRSLTVGFDLRSTGISHTVTGSRRMSLNIDEYIGPVGAKWFQSHTSERRPRVPKKSMTTVNIENKERAQPMFSAKPGRKVSWKDNETNVNNNNNLSEASIPTDGSYMERTVVKRGRSLSANSQQRSAGRVNSAPQRRPRNQAHTVRKGPRGNGRRSSHDFVYDARPDKALSKGYMTMQMTIGNKQVKVYVPKFSPGECLDDVTVERSRVKSAVKAAEGISRPVAGKRK